MIKHIVAMIMMFVIANSQSLSKTGIKNVLKQTGISENEAKKMLMDQDILKDDSDIKEVKTKNIDSDKIRVAEELNQIDRQNETLNMNADFKDIENEKLVSELESKPEIIEEKLNLSTDVKEVNKYFGYDIFMDGPELFQKSINDYVEPNYIIGPGDEIIIMLWGQTELNEPYVVEKDGYVFIENVGQIFVNGLTLDDLEKKLFRLLQKVYSSLNPSQGKATTFFDVSIGSVALRPIRVFVTGEVAQPSAYSMQKTTTLSSSLYYFGGPTNNGSLRNIHLIRGGKKIAEIDFYDFLLTGKQPGDMQLQNDDVVFIPRRKKTVKAMGEISRSYFYELKEDEGVKDLVKIAGNIKSTTFTKLIQIERIMPADQRLKTGIDRTIIDIDLNEILNSKNTFDLYDGDVVIFYSISNNIKNIATINGSVNRPGKYDLENGIRLDKLIAKADGLIGDVYLKRADIIRTNSDLTTTLIDINLGLAMAGDKKHNIVLKSGDVITTYSYSDMVGLENVSIDGYVLNPGEKLFRNDMQLIDLLFEGGGFQDSARLSKTFLDRAELTRLKEDMINFEVFPFNLDSALSGQGLANIILKRGDRIRIYSTDEISGTLNNQIEITGNVKRPGFYDYYDGLRIKDLLFMAGGLDDILFYNTMFLGRADLIRMNDDLMTKRIIPFNLTEILDSSNTAEDKNFILKRNDLIRVYSNEIFNINESVTIEGTINNAGVYDLKVNMNLKDLILEAGGIEPDILSYRVDIASFDDKKDNEMKYSTVNTYYFSNNKSNYLTDSNGSSEKIILKNYDIVTIRPAPHSLERYKVTINGYVYYPGDYVIQTPNELVTDIIDRAGGLKADAYAFSSSLTRNGKVIRLSFDEIINRPKSKKNFSVMNGDTITIGSRSELVTIIGAVSNPGNYQYLKGYSLKDYLRLAGGLTSEASKYATYVEYPNGSSKKMSFFKFSPKIYDGSIINVGTKAQVEKFSFTEYATNLTSIYADLSQAYLLILLAGNQ